MKYIDKTLIVTTLLLASCSSDIGNYTPSLNNQVEVVIAAQDASTRTELDDDLSSVKWSIGDEVALWATGVSDGSTALQGDKFTLRYYGTDYSRAEFSSIIDAMSDEQEYSYTSFYPYPDQISGSVVNYTIPTYQSGSYDGSVDFRIADAVVGEALSSSTMNGCSLSFRSLTHILKISIPEGYNKLGVPISKLQVTLPTSAAGTLSCDMSDTSTTPTFTSNGSKTITLNLSEPIDAGDGNCVWLFMNPMSDVTGDISICGISSDNKMSCSYLIPLENHTFSAGHITPVYTEIGEELSATTIQITIAQNNLGEDLTNINLTAPEGAIFLDSGKNTATLLNDGTNTFSVQYVTSEYKDAFDGASLQVEYESNSALIPSTEDLVLSSINDNTINTFERTVPHILYEDFKTISSFNKDDNTGVGGTSTNSGDQDVVDLSSYGLTTAGWTATRVGGGEGKAIRICARYESGASITTNSPGRIDSPALSYLKDGAKINVSYNYKGGRYSAYKSGIFSSWSYGGNGNTTYDYGSDTTQTGMVGSTSIESPYATDVVVEDTDGSDSNSSQDYDNINYSDSFTVDNASSSTRISWRVKTTFSYTYFFGTNGNFWLYLDNVCVTIAK
ncbi:MAG: fimbrillin family protein [Rikenellaceae bacterium]